MVNKLQRSGALAALTILLTACAFAQDRARWLDVEFPHDSPVLPVSFSLGPTTAGVRGMSMALDLHASLVLRNTGTKPICGLTLRVDAQDLTPSGRGSVTLPSLNVQPGEVFPVKIDMQLLRPFNVAKTEGAIVKVSLDCALYSDFSSYGPDALHSRRALMVYELEARRDRRYLAKLLRTGKLAELREELNFGLQNLHPRQLGLELLHEPLRNAGRERAVPIGAVSFPSSPVQPVGGAANVLGNQVSSPRVELKNTSQKSVRSVEMGWIVQDDQGRDFIAGLAPALTHIEPVQTGFVTETETFRLSHPAGRPLVIGALMAFVNDVEFADGKLWIPTRLDIKEATSDPVLRRALATSPEQQRLAEVYRRKGIGGVAEELKNVD